MKRKYEITFCDGTVLVVELSKKERSKIGNTYNGKAYDWFVPVN